jgi:hypothetical protein
MYMPKINAPETNAMKTYAQNGGVCNTPLHKIIDYTVLNYLFLFGGLAMARPYQTLSVLICFAGVVIARLPCPCVARIKTGYACVFCGLFIIFAV